VTIDEARRVLARRTNNLLQVQGVESASHLVAIVAATTRPPASALWPDGLARFPIRLDRETWEALKVLVDAQFAPKGRIVV
jgi:hypothetical protein